MSEHTKKDLAINGGASFDIGEVQNSEGIAVGPNAQATVNRTTHNYYGEMAKTITDTQVHCYLERLKAGTPAPAHLTPAQIELWNTEFCAHNPDAMNAASTDLSDAVDAVFAEDRRIKRIQRCVLLAEAGMGKTPALYYLRTNVASRSLKKLRAYLTRKQKDTAAKFNKKSVVVPLFIQLADLQTGLSMPLLVRDSFNREIAQTNAQLCMNSNQLDSLLEQYQCLFLFDGLDELFSKSHRGSLQILQQFMESHPTEEYVISCRTASYRSQIGSIDTLFLDDLDEEQARTIVGADTYATLTASLQQLGRNRAVLNMILGLTDSEAIIETKGQLIQNLVHRRLHGDVRRDTVSISMETAEGLLEWLAYTMHCNHQVSCDERELMTIVRAYLDEWYEPYTWREVIAALKDLGMIDRDEKRRWAFCDRTTAAYFTAAMILRDPARLTAVLQEVSELWWREVVEILVGLSSDPVDLLFELIDRDVLVAAHCAQYAGVTVNDHVEDAIIDALIERMAKEDSATRRRIVLRLGESDHPRAAEALVRALHREWSSMVLLCIARAIWKQWSSPFPGQADPKRETIEEIEARIMHAIPQSRENVAYMLHLYNQAINAEAAAERAEYEQKLMLSMENRASPRMIRGLAAIGLGFSGTEQARDALLETFMSEEIDDFVAWCVADALTLRKDETVEACALDIFKAKKYKDSQWDHHRARALYVLGWISSGRNIGRLLRAAIKDKENAFVRGQAVQAVTRLDMPDALHLLEARLGVEDQPHVLRKIAEGLGQIGTPMSIPILTRHLHHERVKTRWMVRKAIAEIKQRHMIV